MLVINDLMNCVYKSGETEKAFTKPVCHWKFSILYIFLRAKNSHDFNQMQNAWSYLRTSLCS